MITSTANERIKHVRSLQRSEVRRRERSFVVEGVRLVEEALRAGAHPSLCLIVADQLAKSARGRRLLGELRGCETIPVTERVLAFAADTVTPQGVVAVLPFPEPPLLRGKQDLGPLVLVLDGLRDPGNLGTILRSASASGVLNVVLTPDCVDVFSPKVVRAGMGAHFHLMLSPDRDWNEIKQLLAGIPILLAATGEGQPYFAIDWREQCALIVGGEAEGASDAARALATGFVHIPMVGPTESLNAAVAASIILFESLRQRLTIQGQ